MAYVILSNTERELNRVELSRSPVVIGRAPECEISIHDILLSRRHCRLTPTSDGWLVIDLGSRNGTCVDGRKIEQRRLKDGDVVLLGKTRVTFHAAELSPAYKSVQRPAAPMPADPAETAAGTVFALEYTDPEVPIAEPLQQRRLSTPIPKPRPRDPDSFEDDDVYTMLEQIASSSWDSIYAINAQPLRRDRPMPRPRVVARSANHRPSVPRFTHAGPRISLDLQATAPDHANAIAAAQLIRPTPRRTCTAAMLLRRRLSRWVAQVGHLRLFSSAAA